MKVNVDRWPSVPSSSGATTQGSGKISKGTEGAKNLWFKTGCHWKLDIGTYNARTLLSDSRVNELEEELSNIKFDVIGLSEVRRKGTGRITLSKSEHHFYWKGGHESKYGVGFIVNKNIAGNIIGFNDKSERIAQLTLKVNKNHHINIIQAYLPTSAHSDADVDAVYEDIEEMLSKHRAKYNIVLGDFNAKIGTGNTELCTGKFGLGTRNDRGDMLINFSLKHKLKIMNSFFEKKAQRRWTWISPNSQTKNEIDFVLSDTPSIFTDVSVLNSFNTGSDHRLLRAHIILNTKIERAKMIKKVGKVNSQNLTTKKKEFQLLLTNRFTALSNDDIDQHCEKITETISKAASEIAGKATYRKPDKLSTETKLLREKRRKMKRDGSRKNVIEYSEICKTIRSRMAFEIASFNEKEQLDALEANKGTKTISRKQSLGKQSIPNLKEEDGTIIHDFDRMIKRCEEFYTSLYSSKSK